jgi:hypothetical protein
MTWSPPSFPLLPSSARTVKLVSDHARSHCKIKAVFGTLYKKRNARLLAAQAESSSSLCNANVPVRRGSLTYGVPSETFTSLTTKASNAKVPVRRGSLQNGPPSATCTPLDTKIHSPELAFMNAALAQGFGQDPRYGLTPFSSDEKSVDWSYLDSLHISFPVRGMHRRDDDDGGSSQSSCYQSIDDMLMEESPSSLNARSNATRHITSSSCPAA